MVCVVTYTYSTYIHLNVVCVWLRDHNLDPILQVADVGHEGFDEFQALYYVESLDMILNAQPGNLVHTYIHTSDTLCTYMRRGVGGGGV